MLDTHAVHAQSCVRPSAATDSSGTCIEVGSRAHVILHDKIARSAAPDDGRAVSMRVVGSVGAEQR